MIPDDYKSSPKNCQLNFAQAHNRLAINRIKLFDGAKNVEELGQSKRSSIITKHGYNNRDTSNYAHSLIDGLRASKEVLTSSIADYQIPPP